MNTLKYDLFLFDLDDTLLDFRASEKLSFSLAMNSLGVKNNLEALFQLYHVENQALWKLFEDNKVTKDHLKVERFRKIFNAHKLELDPALASQRYLDALPETVVLIDHSVEICEWLSQHGEIGIITNGISSVQSRRINKSKLAPYISFVSVSEDCGFSKPDIRFFEHTTKIAKKFTKVSTVIVGDRQEADILGSHNFGIDGCWFNPDGIQRTIPLAPAFEIKHLSEIRKHFLKT